MDGIPCTLLGPNATCIQAAPHDPEAKLGHYQRPRELHMEGALLWWSLDFQGREIEFPTRLVRFTDLEWPHSSLVSDLSVYLSRTASPQGPTARQFKIHIDVKKNLA